MPPYVIVALKKPERREKSASLLLQRHRSTDRGVDKRRADFPLPSQGPQSFRGNFGYSDMATVLPQGRFDNITDKYIREFIISDF